MIPRIKRGNNIPVKFTVMENGEQKDMSGVKDLSWTLRHAVYGCRRMPEMKVLGGSNPYTVEVNTTPASLLGIYFLELGYKEMEEARAVDAIAFDLVEHSASCSCMEPNKAICLLADTCIGERGPAGQITEVTANVGTGEGNPAVVLVLGGTPEQRTIDFRFDGLTPHITADQEGVIYSNEKEVTDVVKVAAEGANTTSAAANEAAKGANTAAAAANEAARKAEGTAREAVEATQKTNAAAEAAQTAAAGANTAADRAGGVAESAEEAASRADAAAASAALVKETVEGSDVSLDVVGNREYLCGELAALTLNTVESSPDLSIIRFRSGAVGTQLVLPDDLKYTGWAIAQANTPYDIFIWMGTATIVYHE